jgi:hypothetical protein
VSHNVWKSTDSGINWVQKTNWWAVVHTDMHHISFSPHNKSKHFNSNDGGIWLTTDGTNSWSQKSDGLAANEISPAASSNLDYKCISTGTQDNGELYRDDTGVWKTNRGGDWYEKMNYDWKNPRTVYYITGKRRLVNGSEVSLNFPFTGNANYIDFNPKAQNSAVISKNDSLWISKNIQDPIPSWSFIGAFSGNNIKSVAWSIKDTNRLYLINSNSKVYRTDNLYSVTPLFNLFNTPSTTNTAASIAVIAKNDSIVYISCGNIIYRSNNAGNTWTNIKYNYPAVNVIRLYHDPYTSNESIYVVGSIAVYFKMDTMTSWQNLTQSLPTNASIQSVIPYNEGTDKSEMRVAYFGKGVWSIPIQTQKIPNAKFGANFTQLCSTGKSVMFADSSSNNPTSWSWSFPGGTPSSSTLQNPTIVYNTPGVYDVSLTASNANGSYTETKTAYISVFKGDTLPISENFESGTLPVNWTVFNDGNDNRFWVREDTLSAYGVGSKSYRFNNRAYMTTSKKDAIITSVLNLNMYDSVWVSFDRAFAISYWSQWYGDSRDTLQVAVDNSCNTGSLTSVWMKGHTALATGPVQADGAYFKPTPSQWKKDTINLTAFAGQKEISLYFRIFKTLSGGYGQVIYLDNINFWGKKVVVKDTAFSASICSENNYNFGANTLNTAGTYKDTIRKVNTGADSIRRTLVLTVNPKTNGMINQSICQGQSFLFNGINRTVSGAYLDTLVNAKGCDSFLTLNLTVNPNSSKSINQTICQGQSFLFNGINRTVSGTYLDTLVNSKGCDSFLTLNLTVNPNLSNFINQTICQGQSFLFNGINRTVSGAYLDTLVNAKGCDSFLTLNLTVNPNSSNSINQTICQGQSFLFNGINRTVSGTYLDTLVNSKGCDSFLTLNLTVNLNSNKTISQSICLGQSFLFNGINRTASGTYLDTLVNAKGCDSFLTLNLTVNPNSSNSISQTICQGQLFLFNGINRTVSGTYLDTLVNSKGCDSILTLNLTVNPNSSKSISQTICQGQSFLFNGINRTASGTYLDTLVNAKGCDSILTLNLTVTPSSSKIISQTICQGQSVMFNGIGRTTSGTYLDTLVNSKGCDSILTLNLTVNPLPQPVIIGDSILCDSVVLTLSQNFASYLWSTGGNSKSIVVKNSGNYVCVVTSTDGCTNQASFSIINGKINNQPLIQVSKNIICSSSDSAELSASAGFNNYKWSNNIQGTNKIVVKSSGNYFVTVYNNMGCSAIANTTILSKPVNNLQIGLNSKYCIEDSIIPFDVISSIPCLSSQKTFNNVTASNLNFKNYVAGKYMASYTCIDTNNCSTIITKEISLVNCPLSGLATNDFSNKIIVYPNPARNSFVIEFLEMGQYQIAVYSTLGQLIHNQSVDNEKQLKMDVSKWAKGVYYIRIYSKDMNLMDTKKLEIE